MKTHCITAITGRCCGSIFPTSASISFISIRRSIRTGRTTCCSKTRAALARTRRSRRSTTLGTGARPPTAHTRSWCSTRRVGISSPSWGYLYRTRFHFSSSANRKRSGRGLSSQRSICRRLQSRWVLRSAERASHRYNRQVIPGNRGGRLAE